MTIEQKTHVPVELFYSYSHRDEELRNELQTHLSLLQRENFITAWHDRGIEAGQEWGDAIDSHLQSAKIILLLISPDFLASDYCYDIEVQRAMERYEQGQAAVIPVLLRHCDWHSAPFGKLQAIPRDDKPVDSANRSDRDKAFMEIAQAIRLVAQRLATNPH